MSWNEGSVGLPQAFAVKLAVCDHTCSSNRACFVRKWSFKRTDIISTILPSIDLLGLFLQPGKAKPGWRWSKCGVRMDRRRAPHPSVRSHCCWLWIALLVNRISGQSWPGKEYTSKDVQWSDCCREGWTTWITSSGHSIWSLRYQEYVFDATTERNLMDLFVVL